MWKFWKFHLSFGIEKDREFDLDIPSVKDIQSTVLITKRNALAQRLAEGGHGTIYTASLTPDSVARLIQECVDKGYTVAKHGPQCFKADELFVYVGGSESSYIKEYGGEVIAQPTT